MFLKFWSPILQFFTYAIFFPREKSRICKLTMILVAGAYCQPRATRGLWHSAREVADWDFGVIQL